MDDVTPGRDYERSDASSRLIAALAAGLAATVIAVPLALNLLYPSAANRGDIGHLPKPPPAPRLQIDPPADLKALRAAERERLTTFGWVDRQQQIARIPIERAMEIIAAGGRAGWSRPAADADRDR